MTWVLQHSSILAESRELSRPAADVLRAAAGWVILITLLVAPWMMAGLPMWSVAIVSTNGLLAATLWIASVAASARLPRVPMACVVMTICMLVLGWGAMLAARAAYVWPAASFAAAASKGSFGTVDAYSSYEALLPISAALAILMVVADLSVDAAWRSRIWSAVVACGVGVGAYGLLGRSGLMPALVAPQPQALPSFGPFRYHGIAGAFLNTIIPLGVAAIFALAITGRHHVALAVGAGVAACVAAAVVNVSKTGMVLAPVLVVVTALAIMAAIRPSARTVRRAGGWLLTAVSTAAVIVTLTGWDESWKRWKDFLAAPPHSNARIVMWGVCLPMAADAGAFGYGPGTFKLLLPHTPHMDDRLYSNWIVTEHVPGSEVSHWSYACNDYLQCLIEWGWIGALLWAGIFGGGVIRVVAAVRDNHVGMTDRILLIGVATSLAGVLLYATVEWPLQVASIQMYVAALLGLAWGSRRWAKVDGERSCASC